MIFRKAVYPAIGVVAAMAMFACAHSSALRTETVAAINPGSYRMVLQGNNYFNDLRTVVFLDREDDKTELSPFTPDFEYRVLTGVPSEQAMALAEKFLRSNPLVHSIALARIMDAGEMIGYEVRPQYLPYEFGAGDPLDIGYYRKGGELRVIIRLKPGMDPAMQSGPDSRVGW